MALALTPASHARHILLHTMMSDSGIQPGLQPVVSYDSLNPEQFTLQMRRRAEEAIVASVHHASLSQQYLALSQKFAALAEQAMQGGVRHQAAIAGDSGNKPQPAPLEPQSSSQQSSSQESSSQESATTPTAAADQPPRRTRPSPRRKGRSKKPRELAERFRLMAPVLMERIRIRTRRSDLKPQLRSAVEDIKQSRGSVVVSIALFVGVVILLNVLQLQVDVDAEDLPITATFSEKVEPPEEEPMPVEQPLEDPGEQQQTPADDVTEEPEPEPEPEPMPEPEPEPEVSEEAQPEPPMPESDVSLDMPDPAETSVNSAASESSPKFNNRGAEGRQLLLQKYGGSAASESAVGQALEWLALRQRRDGSWDFVDVAPCSNPGTVNNPIGGTAYALLPFLAAGQTHRDRTSRYHKQVEAGLNYLMTVGVQTPAGYDLRGVLNKGVQNDEPHEAYYVHGAATLALCEAYGMTRDRRLKPAAEGALQFLINSQDPRGGGWRYRPQQPGSTSVTTIQLLALMAARKAELRFSDASLMGVTHYLDSVQVDQQGRYGYEIDKKSYQASITAMALLCRMYLGWGRTDGDLAAGVQLLDKRGPYDNLYYNYFATQVLRNWGGDEWNRWNERLRDDLISWQETEGDARGSWAPRDRSDYSRAGGRLLTTCLATLTLQVYYRYEPLLPDTDITQTSP